MEIKHPSYGLSTESVSTRIVEKHFCHFCHLLHLENWNCFYFRRNLSGLLSSLCHLRRNFYSEASSPVYYRSWRGRGSQDLHTGYWWGGSEDQVLGPLSWSQTGSERKGEMQKSQMHTRNHPRPWSSPCDGTPPQGVCSTRASDRSRRK